MTDRDETNVEGVEATSEASTPFRLVGIEDFAPDYANFVHLSHDFYSFHVAFSRVVSPIIVTDEDRDRFVQEGWKAQVVSRLVVPAPAFAEMVRIMQQSLETYQQQFGGEEGSESQDNEEPEAEHDGEN